jgi:hypothetical protein
MVSSEAEKMNTYCPVMPEMLADPNMYIDYEGKRVYLCCPNCKGAFLRDPGKYLHRLPQFGGAEASIGHDQNHDHGAGISTFGLIRPAGILTFSLLVLTVTVGLLRRKRPKLLFKWHKRLGIATLVAAALHLLVILMAH